MLNYVQRPLKTLYRREWPRRDARQGSTLTEVLVASAILVFAMAGAYRLTSAGVRVRTSAHHHYLAVLIANNRLERAKLIRYEDLPLLREDRVAVDANGIPAPNGPFLRTTQVQMGYRNNSRVAYVRVIVETPQLRRRSDPRASEFVSTLLTQYREL